jgi:hypothetical protein
VTYACEAPKLLQGGSFDCDVCKTYPTLRGPHRGAAIADGGNLLAEPDPQDPQAPPGAFYDDLLIGGTSGAWLKASSDGGLGEAFRNHTGTVALFRGDVAGLPAGATATTCMDDDDAEIRLISTPATSLDGSTPRLGLLRCWCRSMWTVSSPDRSTSASRSSASGTWNGDGTEDFAIGAPGRDNRTADPATLAANGGRCYVVSGADISAAVSAPGQETLVIGESVPNGSGGTEDRFLLGDLTVAGSDFGCGPGDRLGHAIAGRVDLDRDGDLDLVVGAPMYSTTPSTTFSFAPEGYDPDGNPTTADALDFPDWGGTFRQPQNGRALGRATVWDWPDQSPLAAPTASNWQMLGFDDGEMVGWKVKALGNLDGIAGQDIGICSRNFTAPTRDGLGVCTSPCFQEAASLPVGFCPNGSTAGCPDPGGANPDSDPNAGGFACGSVTVHQASDGLIRYEFRGEDTRDSLGWGMARLDTTPSGQRQLVLGSGRWPGGNSASPVNENGRVYVFEPASMTTPGQ